MIGKRVIGNAGFDAGFKPVPTQELIQSARSKRKRERDTVGGIKYDKTNRRFVRHMSEVYD